MNKTILAIPSFQPGGLDAGMGIHFGYCDLYTIVKVENNTVAEHTTLPAIPHQQGGYMAPVPHLAMQGVNALLAGGMGLRLLMAFNQMEIQVYFSGQYPTVGSAVQAFCEGNLHFLTTEDICGGDQ